MDILTKTCSKCGQTKTIDLFRKDRGQCKACRSEQSKKQREKRHASISIKKCTACGETKTIDNFYVGKNKCKICFNKQNKEYRSKNKEKIAEYHRNRYAENKEKISVYRKKHYKENKEREIEYSKKWAQENSERVLENRRNWYKDNPEYNKEYGEKYRYKPENKEKIAAKGRKWCKENPDKVAAKSNRYRASKLQRTPKWSDDKKILAVYAESDRLTKETGIQHHVDHIIPLQGELVSGLHVHTNLQVLTGGKNLSKSNKFSVN